MCCAAWRWVWSERSKTTLSRTPLTRSESESTGKKERITPFYGKDVIGLFVDRHQTAQRCVVATQIEGDDEDLEQNEKSNEAAKECFFHFRSDYRVDIFLHAGQSVSKRRTKLQISPETFRSVRNQIYLQDHKWKKSGNSTTFFVFEFVAMN